MLYDCCFLSLVLLLLSLLLLIMLSIVSLMLVVSRLTRLSVLSIMIGALRMVVRLPMLIMLLSLYGCFIVVAVAGRDGIGGVDCFGIVVGYVGDVVVVDIFVTVDVVVLLFVPFGCAIAICAYTGVVIAIVFCLCCCL